MWLRCWLPSLMEEKKEEEKEEEREVHACARKRKRFNANCVNAPAEKRRICQNAQRTKSMFLFFLLLFSFSTWLENEREKYVRVAAIPDK